MCRKTPARFFRPCGQTSVSKSSDRDLRRQKRPFFRQHFLKRWPDLQGHRSLRPSFSTSSLLPWTIRTPRFTCVSDGYPRRRLLIDSKKRPFVEWLFAGLAHDAPPLLNGVSDRHRATGEVHAEQCLSSMLPQSFEQCFDVLDDEHVRMQMTVQQMVMCANTDTLAVRTAQPT